MSATRILDRVPDVAQVGDGALALLFLAELAALRLAHELAVHERAAGETA